VNCIDANESKRSHDNSQHQLQINSCNGYHEAKIIGQAEGSWNNSDHQQQPPTMNEPSDSKHIQTDQNKEGDAIKNRTINAHRKYMRGQNKQPKKLASDRQDSTSHQQPCSHGPLFVFSPSITL
jgi:hypothetical protein